MVEEQGMTFSRQTSIIVEDNPSQEKERAKAGLIM
jgi:hypothetical protein